MKIHPPCHPRAGGDPDLKKVSRQRRLTLWIPCVQILYCQGSAECPRDDSSGSVFLYILIGIALLAGLMFVLTRSQNTQEGSVLTQSQTETAAQTLMTYVGEVSQAWAQLHDSGVTLDDVVFTLPTAGSFNTPPNTAKLFHPDGGGVQYNDMNNDSFRASNAAPVGWKFVLVEADFTETAAPDFLMTYIRLKKDICGAINKTITGSTTIPTVTTHFNNTFRNGITDLTEAGCAECKTYPSICVQNGGVYAFYNLIAAR